MELENLAPEGSFVSTSHFHGIVIQYKNDKVLFYHDDYDEENSGFITVSKDDLIDAMQTEEHLVIKVQRL